MSISSHIAFVIMTGVLGISVTLASADVNRDVTIVIKQAKQLKPVEESLLYRAPAIQTLAALNNYRFHPDKHVRLSVIYFISDVALHSGNARVLQEGARKLLDTAQRENWAVSDYTLRSLAKFPQIAFTQEREQRVVRRLLQKSNVPSPALLVAGISADPKNRDRLKNLAKRPLGDLHSPWQSQSWAAHLALARLGDTQEIQFCIRIVETVQDPVAQMRLLEDLDYVRQPQTTQKLIEYLLGNRTVPSEAPDVPTVNYARYALDLLSKSIVGFPQFNANQEQRAPWLSRAQDWAREHRDNLLIKR